jgi:hypothetical protein
MSSLIEKRPPHRRVTAAKADSFALDEALTINYELDLNQLTPLYFENIVQWHKACGGMIQGPKALDKLYSLN